MSEGNVKTQYDPDRRLVEISGLFDPVWYLKENPDLSTLPKEELLDHFMKHGFREGRSPGPQFDVRYYLETYPDIAEADLNPLVHFLQSGADEGRWPAPLGEA